MIKPLIVYVSGAPGSGKTTLAQLLSEQLYIPLVSSDLIHGGIALLQPEHDRKQTLKNVFVPTMIDMSQKRYQIIADHVLQKGVSETNIIDKLRPYANIVYVHTVASNPIERYTQRVQSSELPSVVQRKDHLLKLAVLHNDNLTNTSEPLELGLPILVVRTNDGYSPDLNKILEFIRAGYKS